MDQGMLSFEPAPAVLSRAQAAIAAAQAGDWKPANDMEMDFLNDPANGIWPGCIGATPDEHGNAKAYAITRHDDGLHVLWVAPEGWVSKLVRCDHRNADKKNVHVCGDCETTGWYSPSELLFIETDIDGRIIDEDESDES